MKARVIETGEIVEVKRLYPTVYSRLDKNNKIAEEYYDDEIELIDKPKKVSIQKVCKWLENNMHDYFNGDSEFAVTNDFITCDEFIENFKKAMEE